MMKNTLVKLICSELLYFLLSCHFLTHGGIVFGKYVSKSAFGAEQSINS